MAFFVNLLRGNISLVQEFSRYSRKLFSARHGVNTGEFCRWTFIKDLLIPRKRHKMIFYTFSKYKAMELNIRTDFNYDMLKSCSETP